MKTENLYIAKGDYLNKILSRIPTNTLLFKNITGIGATYSEIMDKTRNSIIIVPNVPVIQGKRAKHTHLLGVYEGIGKDQIKRFLKKSKPKFKKIMVTPESLSRVLDSLKELEIDYLNEYFLLIDEFDKMTHDSDFREEITFPMSLFFEFKNKAMVSATPIIPSDTRFEKHNFTIKNIVPTYPITRELKLITTNSVLDAFKSKLESCKSDKIFVFFKSLAQISNYINSLNIESESSIFTSKEEVKEFYNKRKEITPYHLGYILDETKFSKYNFLTSRYFTAVDIDIEEDADVFILADLKVSHTIIDPSNEIIQILGRFRKNNIKSAHFITDISPSISFKSQEQCKAYLEANQEVFNYLKTMRFSTPDLVIKEVIDDLIDMTGYKIFVNKDYSINYFLRDNYCLSNHIKSLYIDIKRLMVEFKNVKIYNTEMKYFNVLHEDLPFSNLDLDKVKFRDTSIPFLEKLNTIIDNLNELQDIQKRIHAGEYVIGNMQEMTKYLLEKYPEIFNIFMDEGEDRLREIAKSQLKLSQYYQKTYLNDASKNYPLISELQEKFRIGEVYKEASILTKFFMVAKNYDIGIKRNKHCLGLFIETKKISKLNGQRRLEITGFIHKK
ncbi:hypothetical protein ACK8HY_15175 [Sphingobacterium sp. NGMCC 1.201703]|uniref:hypothetical protein n=1 Tax=Sphingobacterium sp. NGMCC 1.201703 TaxID=3388657 RepID=UPI0039FDAB25